MAEFDSNNQPEKRRGRGKAFKTKLFEAIRQKALLDSNHHMSDEEVEGLFIQHLAYMAMSEDKPDLHMLKDLMNRSFAPLKPTMDTFNFELDPEASPSEKAQQILIAAANGDIPPDVGKLLIDAAKSTLDIEALTELKERIEKLEEMYQTQQSE